MTEEEANKACPACDDKGGIITDPYGKTAPYPCPTCGKENKSARAIGPSQDHPLFRVPNP